MMGTFTAHLNFIVLLFCSFESFLSQARASLRPTHAWFLKIDPVRIVSMCVCLCVRP